MTLRAILDLNSKSCLMDPRPRQEELQTLTLILQGTMNPVSLEWKDGKQRTLAEIETTMCSLHWQCHGTQSQMITHEGKGSQGENTWRCTFSFRYSLEEHDVENCKGASYAINSAREDMERGGYHFRPNLICPVNPLEVANVLQKDVELYRPQQGQASSNDRRGNTKKRKRRAIDNNGEDYDNLATVATVTIMGTIATATVMPGIATPNVKDTQAINDHLDSAGCNKKAQKTAAV